MNSRFVNSLLIAGVVAASASANSLTTLFASNNGGNAGGMVYFDLAVGANSVTITGFDTNTSLAGGGSFGFSVYTILGTYVGNTTNQALWTLQTTGTGSGMGLNNPSPVTLNNSFVLNANTTYGIALGMGPEADHRYTNGTGSNQNFSDGNISLTLGAASNVQFTGTPFSPRVWNGTVYYSPVPEPASMAVLGLGALALIRRRRARK